MQGTLLMVYGFTEIALSIVSIVVCVFYYDEEEEQQHTCRVMLDLHLLKVKCYQVNSVN